MFGPLSVLRADVKTPDDLLDGNGLLRLLPSTTYDRIGFEALRLWCHRNARYGLPTEELIPWLREQIGGRRAIEIGAGSGDLCSHLGIVGTDNWMQTWPEIRAIYDATGQPTIKYGTHIHNLPAADAIALFRPEVVVASWVTQWVDPELPPPPAGGNMYGVKENEIIDAGITYILIGNLSVHGGKDIMRREHKTYPLPFLRSRSAMPEMNRVWIWNS